MNFAGKNAKTRNWDIMQTTNYSSATFVILQQLVIVSNIYLFVPSPFKQSSRKGPLTIYNMIIHASSIEHSAQKVDQEQFNARITFCNSFAPLTTYAVSPSE